MTDKLTAAVEYLESNNIGSPKIGLILGSGMGNTVDNYPVLQSIGYEQIPGFKQPTVAGHQGQLKMTNHYGVDVIWMQGRLHYYEGHSVEDMVFPIRVMKELGVQKLLITNAAGGVSTYFHEGDFMVLDGHLGLANMTFSSAAAPGSYCPQMRTNAMEAASNVPNLTMHAGVYAMVSGPSYETPAEVKMLRTLGADAVGMSTVPEVLTAQQLGMKVLGISCITNMASGITNAPLSHEEVMETSSRVKADFADWLDRWLALETKGESDDGKHLGE
ncbi:purine-nucleoside phosphorylase [Aureibacillus halotolerans]|nr:purine-nucleoside phosphorylase [Aureibacillus halotolerans]